MKEIKSFREYIAEQELLKEGPYDDEFKNSELTRKGENSSQSSDNSPSSSPIVGKIDKDNYSDTDNVAPQLPSDGSTTTKYKPLEVSDKVDLKIRARTPQERIKKLNEKARYIENTFKHLSDFIYNGGIIEDKKDPDPGTSVLDITNKTSFEDIRRNWEQKFKASIGQQKEIRDAQYWTKILRSRTSSKEEKKEAYERLSKLVPSNEEEVDEITTKPKQSEDANKPEEKEATKTEAAKKFLQKEEAIEEAWHPFKTVSEIAAGVGNPWSPDRILTTISKGEAANAKDRVGRLGVFGTINVPAMTERYQNDAKSIISKEKREGLAYYNRAIKNLNKYNVKLKFLRISDNDYLDSISEDLNRAESTLYHIGANLQNLMAKYNEAFKVVYDERIGQTEKTRETVTGLNTTTAMKRYTESQAKKAEREQKAEERKNLRQAKKEERKNLRQAKKEAIEAESEKGRETEKAIKKFAYDEICKAFKIAIDGKRKYNINDLLSRVESDINAINKITNSESSGKRASGKYSQRKGNLDPDDQMFASALASKIIYSFFENNIINNLLSGASTDREEKIKNAFNEKYDEIRRRTKSAYPDDINIEIKNDIERPKENEQEAKKKNAFKRLSSFIKRNNNQSSANKANNQNNANVEVSAKKFYGVRPMPAKDFDESSPKDSMSILQYATLKAQKNNEK